MVEEPTLDESELEAVHAFGFLDDADGSRLVLYDGEGTVIGDAPVGAPIEVPGETNVRLIPVGLPTESFN